MTNDVATISLLDANLAGLGEANQDVADAIRAAAPTPLDWSDTPSGVPAATLDGRALCSRHRPLDEADRLIADVDLVDHAVVAVLGFGVGYHVQRLAEQFGRGGVVIVYEPDVALLRAVFERVDLRPWLESSLVVWVLDPDDQAALATKLRNAESIIAQGLHVLEHPASRERLGDGASRFVERLGELVTNAKTTLLTTLVRSVDTVRNLLLNVDHYAAGTGIEDLRDRAIGRLGVIVSAGPSLQHNIHQLAAPGVRDRCVIVATQTTLKPLIRAGVRPHFVTALDFHEISRRFYEGLDPGDLDDTVLVVDPKAHPIIVDSYPGRVRCCASSFLDRLLGPIARPMGELPAGATVAHLAYYLARHLGCDPVAFIGQDLGFSDGLYYASGTAIDEVWSPELSPFNTIDMMEWQRIVRHRPVLKKVRDVNGRSIYTDQQMLAYLQQFERDFAEDVGRGRTIIDATEGGVEKRHAESMSLRSTLRRHAREVIDPLPLPPARLDPRRLEQTRRRLDTVCGEVVVLRDTARETAELLERMLRDQADSERMERHFRRLDRLRGEVERRMETFELLNHLNQLGAFKRFKADRRLHMSERRGESDPDERQRAQLERDLQNVRWLGDAADELLALLARTESLIESSLKGGPLPTPAPDADVPIESAPSVEVAAPARVGALVAIDPSHGGLGTQRSLDSEFAGRSVLQRTLERLGWTEQLESIVLLVPDDFDVERLLRLDAIARPVHVERCGHSVFGPRQRAVRAARAWSDTGWRGGIANMSVFDEVLAPAAMHAAMERHGLTAGVLCGPDWPMVDVSAESGVDAVVRRHRRFPDQLPFVFTQAPPGIGTCLVARDLMGQLAGETRLSTIGALLGYQPHAPQHDPIARDACVQIPANLRRSMTRATFDTPRYKLRLRRAVEALILDRAEQAAASKPQWLVDAATCVGALEEQWLQMPVFAPSHLILEPCTGRFASGAFSPHRHGAIQRPMMSLRLAERILSQLADARDTVVTFGGVGDPLRHPDIAAFVALARESGVAAVHVRTELLCDPQVLESLVDAGVDVVSIDLHADRAATYRAMMGVDRFRDVLENIDRLDALRHRLTLPESDAGFALPWIVPRLQRRTESFEDVETFFDRWLHRFGAALIESPPPFDPQPHTTPDALRRAVTPKRVMRHELLRRMTVLSDGRVPLSELDLRGEGEIVADLTRMSVLDAWRELVSERRRVRRDHGGDTEVLRTCWP